MLPYDKTMKYFEFTMFTHNTFRKNSPEDLLYL